MRILHRKRITLVTPIKKSSMLLLIGFAIFHFYTATAQRSDFIVKKTGDTVYVEKVTLKYDVIKVKNYSEKAKYRYDEITSFYDYDKKCHYEKVTIPYKKTLAEPRSEFFLIRLTKGKVKLYLNDGLSYYSSYDAITGKQNVPGLPGIIAGKNSSYYIAIFDAKPELLSEDENLKLTSEVYEILKMYLYGNPEIEKKLEHLSNEKPLAKKEKIITLINDYNAWVQSK